MHFLGLLIFVAKIVPILEARKSIAGRCTKAADLCTKSFLVVRDRQISPVLSDFLLLLWSRSCCPLHFPKGEAASTAVNRQL